MAGYYTENAFYDVVQELQELVQIGRAIDNDGGTIVNNGGNEAAYAALRRIQVAIVLEKIELEDRKR